MRNVNPLIVAVDLSDPDEAASLARDLAGSVGLLKVGLELFTAGGGPAVERVAAVAPVFLDLKLHDIPNTVFRAARNAARIAGVEMLTVHVLGGMDMVRAAVDGAGEGAAERGGEPPAILGVTVLSSMGGDNLASPASLAFEAVTAGAGGVVVSGEDVKTVRQVLGEEPLLVVPGIRPAGTNGHDHARILSPREAIDAGADYIVVGRPVTEAPDPVAAARLIVAEATGE